MSVLLLLLLLSLSACGIAAAPVLYRLLRVSSADEISEDWRSRFTPSNYTPMKDLLAKEDFKFVVRQPGFDLRLYRRFRKQRLQTYRCYLRSLICDFNRLQTLARLLLASSSSDHSEFATRLILLRFRFALAVFQAEAACLLWYLGFPTLLAHRAVSMLEELASEVQCLTPVFSSF